MDTFTILWIVWLGIFAAVEGVALANKREGDTLSEHVWLWFATKREGADTQPSGMVRLRRFVLLAGVCWLLAHFLTGGYF